MRGGTKSFNQEPVWLSVPLKVQVKVGKIQRLSKKNEGSAEEKQPWRVEQDTQRLFH